MIRFVVWFPIISVPDFLVACAVRTLIDSSVCEAHAMSYAKHILECITVRSALQNRPASRQVGFEGKVGVILYAHFLTEKFNIIYHFCPIITKAWDLTKIM